MSNAKLRKLVKVLRALHWEFRGYSNGNYHFSHSLAIIHGNEQLLRNV